MAQNQDAGRAAERLAAIVESSEDAIISKNLDGIVQTWNPAAERIYGYSVGAIIGRSIALLIPADRAKEEEEILSKIRRGERVEHFETRRTRGDGKLIDVSLTISPLRDADGNVIGVSHIARDITEQKRVEARLNQTQRLESLGLLASGVAHDFNNLLTGVVGSASLLQEMLPGDSPARVLVKTILTSGQRLTDLTRQLLAYAGKGTLAIKPVDLTDLVRETTGLLRAAVPQNVSIQLHLDEGLPNVRGDPTQIQQIVMNLALNAAEAADKEYAWVVVRLFRQELDREYIRSALAGTDVSPGAYIWLEVSDNGRGMDAATQAKIFDPFFTTKSNGRGLGLASVAGIVRSHRGAIRVYSELGHGTNVKVLLPAIPAAQQDHAARNEEDLRGTATVLLVDDEEMVRRVGTLSLEHYGYRVLPASDGLAALELYQRHQAEVCIVVLDLVMPGLAGDETLHRLRQLNPAVKVIISSGYSDNDALSRLAASSVAGFLKKPFTSRQIARAVWQALDQGPCFSSGPGGAMG